MTTISFRITTNHQGYSESYWIVEIAKQGQRFIMTLTQLIHPKGSVDS